MRRWLFKRVVNNLDKTLLGNRLYRRASSASIGITYVTPKDKHIDTILERADMAMYRAKELGRDQICIDDC